MLKIHTLNHKGDTALEFDLDDATAIEAAEQVVRDHLASGGAAIRTSPGPEEVVRRIEPGTETLVLIPQIQGG